MLVYRIPWYGNDPVTDPGHASERHFRGTDLGDWSVPSTIETFVYNGLQALVIVVYHVVPKRMERVEINQVGRELGQDDTLRCVFVNTDLIRLTRMAQNRVCGRVCRRGKLGRPCLEASDKQAN